MLDISRLSRPVRHLIQDVGYRAQLTSDLLQSDPSSATSVSARDAIDAAVVEILAVAGLPRGPINGPIVEPFGRSWYGRKMLDCRLFIDPVSFQDLSEGDRPDSLHRTWLHESLHARRPYSPTFHREWQEVCGFEEGLAEGLTGLILTEGLGLQPATASYRYYVAAYRSLATVIGFDIEKLWRDLWRSPAGEIALVFLSVVDRILDEQNRAALSRIQRARVGAFAARYFDSQRILDQPDVLAMTATWRRAIE